MAVRHFQSQSWNSTAFRPLLAEMAGMPSLGGMNSEPKQQRTQKFMEITNKQTHTCLDTCSPWSQLTFTANPNSIEFAFLKEICTIKIFFDYSTQWHAAFLRPLFLGQNLRHWGCWMSGVSGSLGATIKEDGWQKVFTKQSGRVWPAQRSGEFLRTFGILLFNCHHFSSSCEKIGISKTLKPLEFLPNSHSK